MKLLLEFSPRMQEFVVRKDCNADFDSILHTTRATVMNAILDFDVGLPVEQQYDRYSTTYAIS
jgi:hypothetical protein